MLCSGDLRFDLVWSNREIYNAIWGHRCNQNHPTESHQANKAKICNRKGSLIAFAYCSMRKLAPLTFDLDLVSE